MKQLLLMFTKPVCLPNWWQDVLTAIPRIAAGFLLTSNFGAAKFGLPWSPAENNLHFFEVAFWFPNDVAAYGGIFKTFPVFFAWMAAFSEAVGGLCILAGFQTRLFSVLIAVTMIVAVFIQHGGHDLWQKLPGLGFLWVAIYCACIGSGRFGLDYLITKKWK